ncbi:uncharacterized protein LOC116348156 [Contarinia nasturtii]|uniref:uncharacterized protein LOC116348156 n=1 Tax=Contarinia nasturtii TaxID=265458 RepID=UPI0012D4B77B|nr:uncharacterized protein LOC116348156 [Contarinia nasturtii]
MKKINLSASSVIYVSTILLLMICICEASNARTDVPLQCYVCDENTCTDDMKNLAPKECSVDNLEEAKVGPSKLAGLSYIKFERYDQSVPVFSCLKIEAYKAITKEKQTVRKCQVNLNETECNTFYNNVKADPLKTYTNVTCSSCYDRNGCNSSGLIYVWAPLLLSSIILCLFIK